MLIGLTSVTAGGEQARAEWKDRLQIATEQLDCACIYCTDGRDERKAEGIEPVVLPGELYATFDGTDEPCCMACMFNIGGIGEFNFSDDRSFSRWVRSLEEQEYAALMKWFARVPAWADLKMEVETIRLHANRTVILEACSPIHQLPSLAILSSNSLSMSSAKPFQEAYPFHFSSSTLHDMEPGSPS